LVAPSDDSPLFRHLADSAPVVDDRVLRALEVEIGRAPVASRSWSRRSRLLTSLLLGALALGLTSVNALGTTAAPLVLLALLASLALGGLVLPLSAPGSARASHGKRRHLVVIIAALAMTYLGFAITGFEPLASLGHAQASAQLWRCGLHGALIGGLCLVALLWPWRRTDPFSPGLLGALLGALSGLAGMLAVDAGCANSEGFHVLLGHGLGVLVLGLVGMALGRRFLPP
jgi:hypothetical protein